jgi:hypothetical protein
VLEHDDGNRNREAELHTEAPDAISSPVAPQSVSQVRFDLHSDESGSEAVPIKKESCEM